MLEDHPLASWLESDGSLYSTSAYISWKRGEELVTLDGIFSSTDLRAIADHIDAINKPEQSNAQNG